MCIKKDTDVSIKRFWIVFLLPCYNILEWVFWGEGFVNISIEPIYVSSLILAAFIEEIIFRRWLFEVILYNMQLKILRSIFITNIVFAVYHLCNIFSYASVTYGIVQSIVAFSFGMAMSRIYWERKSLDICMLSHLLINVSSVLNVSTDVSGAHALQSRQIVALCIISFVYLIYGVRRLKSTH